MKDAMDALSTFIFDHESLVRVTAFVGGVLWFRRQHILHILLSIPNISYQKDGQSTAA